MAHKIVLAAFAVVLGGAASAQDLSSGDWSGFYLGAHVAGGTAVVADNYDSTNEFSFDADGGLGGLQAGYNFQSGAMVYGIEASASSGEISGQGSCFADCPGSGTTPDFTLDRMASLSARVGYVRNSLLFFGSLGVAVADASVDDPTQGGSDSHRHRGVIAGAGVDWAFKPNLSLRAEYQYGRFDKIDYALVSTPDVIGFDTHQIRVGIDWHF